MFVNKKILILSPHIDDAEFGCGGTISKLISNNCEVFYLAFSDCKESIPSHLDPLIMHRELASSIELYGIKKHEVKGYTVRKFDQRRQDILQDLIDIKNTWHPDVVFTPSRTDIHQDHQVITNECIRAFKHTTILGYELPWNCLSFTSDTVIHLSKADVDTKIKALQCYKSQGHRIYNNEDYISALAITRGMIIGKQYAESFETIRFVID